MSDPLINLDKLSEPITKLVEVTATGIGSLYRPLGTVRQAKADARAKIIMAKADAEIGDLEARTSERLQYRESLRQQNIEKVVSLAANEMPQQVSEQAVDIDWTLQFFDTAQDVCDEEMQSLWARILAGEVTSPGSYSKRTLQFLKTLDKFEAEKFVDFCSFVFQLKGNSFFVIDNNATREMMKAKAGNHDLFSHFSSIGLITEPLFGDSKWDEMQVYYFQNKYTFVAQNEMSKQSQGISKIFGYRRLTQTGSQLYSIANAHPVGGYPEELSKQLDLDCEIKLINTVDQSST